MFTGLDKLISDIHHFERDLAAPTSFYQNHREQYLAQARTIADTVLTMLRPQQTKPETWKKKIDQITARTSVSPAGSRGLRFHIASPALLPDGSLSPKDSRPSNQVMSFDDIKQWIQAGINGEPGGKNISNIDDDLMRKKGINAVASIVTKAYHSSRPEANYARLRTAIQRYFFGDNNNTEDPHLLDSVAAAWEAHFLVIIPRDLQQYAARLCHRF